MQIPLPGFSLPPLPEDFSDRILSHGTSYPYSVSFDRDTTRLTHHISKEGDLRIVAPASMAASEIRNLIQLNSDLIIRDILKVRAAFRSPGSSGTLDIHGITIPYLVDYSTKRRTNSVCYYRDGRLVVKVRADATSGEVLDTVQAHKKWIYQQILQHDPHHRRAEIKGFIQIGGEQIPYLIAYSARAKRITLKVNPMMPVMVVAPLDIESGEVHAFIESEKAWIAKKLGRRDLVKDETPSGFIEIGERKITYLIRNSDRAKRIIIRIQADKSVQVVAPHGADPQVIHLFVSEKAGWILKKISSDTRPDPQVRKYLDGDLLLLLGREVPLCVISGVSRTEVHLREGAIEVGIPDGLGPGAACDTVKQGYKWLLEQTLETISREMIRRWSSRLGIEVPRVKFGDQKTRWGVCTSKGIILNIRLAMAPVDIIEYVVVHELCHIRHHNHSPRFWNLVGQMLPGYSEIRARLRRDGALYTM